MDAPHGGLQILDRDELRMHASHPLAQASRPFLRWAGSKRLLLPAIVDVLPAAFGTYREPFLGGGSLFFLLRPESAVISDSCVDLIQTYEAIRDHRDVIVDTLSDLKPDPDFFYRLRANRSTDPAARAAEFIYLNKTCWNGLYRVNSRGEFNVPFGRPKTATIFTVDNLTACSTALAGDGIAIHSDDFEAALEAATEGDLIFLDPPYVTMHNNNGFVDYNETLFCWKDQIRLATWAEKLAARGAAVIVTNANHPEITDLYPSFKRVVVSRASTLASDVRKRRKVEEVILVSHPQPTASV